MDRVKNRLLLALLIVIYVVFSYSFFGGWWYSSIGTCLIILFSYLIWGKRFLKRIGLGLNLQTIGKSILLAVAVAAGSFLLIKYIGNQNNIQIGQSDFRDYVHVGFYVLNEEIVLGAILLFAMVDTWKMRPLVASLCLAILFSVLHFIFYKWIFLDTGVISLTTLTTLFLVGYVRNSLIVQTRHIGYSWALHFGWVIVMFGRGHRQTDTNMFLTEPDCFNLYLGSNEMLFISIILAGLFLIFGLKKSKVNGVSPC